MLSEIAVAFGQRILHGTFNPPTQHWEGRVWDGDRAEDHSALGPAYRDQRQAVMRLLAPTLPGARVIEVGAGTGRYTREILRNGAKEVTALDVSEDALRALRARAGTTGRLKTICGSAWNLGEQDYDVVACFDAIHHLGRLEGVLSMLGALSRTGGYVVGDVWHLDGFHQFQRLRRGRIEHMLSSLRYAGGALSIPLTGRPHPAVRSDLRNTGEIEGALLDAYGSNVEWTVGDYWLTFIAGGR